MLVTASTVASLAASPPTGFAISETLIGTSTGLVLTSIGKLTSGPLNTVAGAVCGCSSVGAILGAIWKQTATGALITATTSAISSGATGASIGLLSGPIGSLIVGVEEQEFNLTFDCWKPILREGDEKQSKGKLLSEIVDDKRVKSVEVKCDDQLPVIVLTNIWNEAFRLDVVAWPLLELVALHAQRI